jgi:hypothetical protein
MGNKRQFVYALISNCEDLYSDMTCLSARFLKHHDPEARVVVVCDTATRSALENRKHPLLRVADDLRTVDTENYTGVLASRWLKVSLHQVISGPFMFLDSDTLPVKPISSIFNTGKPFAATADCPHTDPRKAFPRKLTGTYQKLGWPIPERYFNAGLYFFDASPAARQLGEHWQNSWLQWKEAISHHDQPALNHSIQHCKTRVRVLPQSWNAITLHGECPVWRPKVIHYVMSLRQDARDGQVPLFARLLDMIQEDRLTSLEISRTLKNGDYWFNPKSVRSIVHRGELHKLPGVLKDRVKQSIQRKGNGRD